MAILGYGEAVINNPTLPTFVSGKINFVKAVGVGAKLERWREPVSRYPRMYAGEFKHSGDNG